MANTSDAVHGDICDSPPGRRQCERNTMTLRIEDYALIGDYKTAALVGRDGSIDWLCWPRFDSAACFAALLGDADNGRWLIAPKGASLATSRRYRPGTLVLETEFETETGCAAVIDFVLDAAWRVRVPQQLSSQENCRGTAADATLRTCSRA